MKPQRQLTAVALALAVALVRTAGAQTAPVVTNLMADVKEVADKLVALAKVYPEAKYSWTPMTGVRSFGEVMLHVSGENYFIPAFFGAAIDPATGIKAGDYASSGTYEKKKLTRDQIVAELTKSFANLNKVMAMTTTAQLNAPVSFFGTNSTQEKAWISATTHLHEHLGQAIAYARMQGVVPPWSK
jgi:hypothetical protein